MIKVCTVDQLCKGRLMSTMVGRWLVTVAVLTALVGHSFSQDGEFFPNAETNTGIRASIQQYNSPSGAMC